MTDDKPAMLMRSGLGGEWYVVTQWTDHGNGAFTAIRKRPLVADSVRQLEEMRDAKGWLDAVMDASGLTRDQIADRLDLDVRSVQ